MPNGAAERPRKSLRDLTSDLSGVAHEPDPYSRGYLNFARMPLEMEARFTDSTGREFVRPYPGQANAVLLVTPSLIGVNAARGRVFEMQLRAAYEAAGFEIRKGVAVMTTYGRRFPDFAIYYRGKLVEYIEAKSSMTARYPRMQRLKDAWIEKNTGQITNVVRPDVVPKVPVAPPR
jgi:hypothetical protein